MAAGVECGRQEPCADFKGLEGGWETVQKPPRPVHGAEFMNGRRDLVPVASGESLSIYIFFWNACAVSQQVIELH